MHNARNSHMLKSSVVTAKGSRKRKLAQEMSDKERESKRRRISKIRTEGESTHIAQSTVKCNSTSTVPNQSCLSFARIIERLRLIKPLEN